MIAVELVQRTYQRLGTQIGRAAQKKALKHFKSNKAA